ncbi:MAG: LCP family protein, partial [Patescibacteria group bacterium]|nr:LCP family protein [Patescibacteria group bacterium]
LCIGALIFVLWILFHTVPTATKIIFHQNPTIEQTNGMTNILLLGIGGGTHDGPNLTDTIIFASINQKANTITLISIPRDLWVVNGSTGEKVNEAYADGQDNNNRGLIYTKAVVSHIVGQPIHYAMRIDFGGFVKAVDEVGGVDVTVPEVLDDYHYPIDGNEELPCGHTDDEIKAFVATASADQQMWDFFPCRYKHLHVDTGIQHMDGITALEYVRSRHGVGDQGTDFARSRRQQQVIEAFRSKVLSAGIILNPSKIINLYNIVKESIDTDIAQEDFGPFIALAQKIRSAKIHSVVIDYGDIATGRPGLLVQGPIDASHDFAYTLIPRVGDQNFSEIQSFVSCELAGGTCSVGIPAISPTPVAKK